MVLQAVLLDVGGTLLREARPRPAIYADVARAHGLAVDPETMLARMRAAHRALPEVLDGAYRYSDRWFEAFIGKIFRDDLGLPPERLGAVTAELFERFESAATFRLYPGCRALLDACRARGLALGIVSNWSARLPRVLAAVGIAERVDAVACSALDRAEKPDPALFRRALDRLGVAPDAALHAGNHARDDGYGARGAGVEAILVDHDGKLGREPAARGFRRVGGLEELLGLILSRLP